MTGPTTRLRLRVAPGAAKAAVVGRHGEAWKIRVAAAPERGKANDAALAHARTAPRTDKEDLTA